MTILLLLYTIKYALYNCQEPGLWICVLTYSKFPKCAPFNEYIPPSPNSKVSKNPSLTVLFTSFALSHWNGKMAAFPRRCSASVFLLSCSSSLLYFVWPQRAESDHPAVRHSDTHSPAAIPPVTRRPLRMWDAVQPCGLDDGSARMGTQHETAAWHGAPRWASPAWQLPTRSHAPTLNRTLIIKSHVSVSQRSAVDRAQKIIDFEGTLLCIWGWFNK